jgi:WD40 repeat protein
MPRETQLTSGHGGRVLTNTGVWSPDGKWVVYDTRSDPAGDVFDGTRIEMVHVETREVRVLYESKNGACCGVATWHPREPKVVFILGPENPTPHWNYGPTRRQGVIVDVGKPGVTINLDARDLVSPFTPGALRGGSHVHVFSPDGEWVSFTYEDEVLARFREETPDREVNLRNVGVCVPAGVVRVSRRHPRNHDGTYYSVVVTGTTANPRPGTNEIKKAFEEGWVGSNGYRKTDGRRQPRALAFQGQVVTTGGETISEVFIVDLPGDVRTPGVGPIQGTETKRPAPPKGITQRRLTFTARRKYPGLQGPRHWLRSSPDGSRIGFLMKDDDGMPQFWTVTPNGGEPILVTTTPAGVGSSFTWSPDGKQVTFVTGNRLAVADVATGRITFVTQGRGEAERLRPEACVFSPDARQIAFVVRHGRAGQSTNHIHVVELND